MREFVVTMHSGLRYTVRADRVRFDSRYVSLVLARPASLTDTEGEDVVGLFEQRQVYSVVARDHLVSEEKGEPVDPHFVADDPDSDIPF